MSKSRKETRFDVTKQIEEGLGREARLRILKILVKNPSRTKTLTKYKICVLTGLKAKDVDRHLKKLVETGWVEYLQVGDIKRYKLNMENPNILPLIEFFTKTRYI